jgi:hypothetical protein
MGIRDEPTPDHESRPILRRCLFWSTCRQLISTLRNGNASKCLLHLLTTGYGTKRARAYATDVRNWWKLTYERSGGIRVL